MVNVRILNTDAQHSTKIMLNWISKTVHNIYTSWKLAKDTNRGKVLGARELYLRQIVADLCSSGLHRVALSRRQARRPPVYDHVSTWETSGVVQGRIRGRGNRTGSQVRNPTFWYTSNRHQKPGHI
jgi:hypothetical protein